MDKFWSMICGDCDCSEKGGNPFSYDVQLLKDTSSCINHVLVFCFEVVLLIVLSFIMISKSSSRPFWSQVRYSNMQLVSAITNGSLGLMHFASGIWILEEKLRKSHEVFPLDWWLLELFHGFTWLSVSLTVSLQIKQLSRVWLWMFSVLIFIFSGISCVLSVSSAIGSSNFSLNAALDVLSFLGASLLLLCTYKTCKSGDVDREIGENLYTPLNAQFIEVDFVINVTPFSYAGFFSKILFWWLNPFMKRGQEKTLLDEDIPELRETDRAGSCYLSFVEQLNKQSRHEPSSSSHSSILWTIIMCHRREILITGFFALLKVLTLSSGPLLLNEFILVAEGKKSFKYEGCVLAISLFFIKIIESLSQRQWYFRTRLIGMKIRSLLTAAIYKKILRLSNSARLIHSSGELMNYITVDAYRIGEFPFWFHKTWTTILQLCIALVILFRAIGLATIASLAVIVLTVLCNTPLAKLQHKFQSKLMVAQDERLKASYEALVNMKVLKLYAWEIHFKNAIDYLRNVELKLLSAVQLRRTYLVFLFWTSPMLVSSASFLACYFLKVPLHASNVFTFVATLRLVQDPITSISDVVAVTIQAKVAFARIVNFLEAPELQSENINMIFSDNLKGSVLIKSAEFSWECNVSKPTLRNINLDVKHGQMVAICGEVGSGKSTLLATILGEVPNTKGTIDVHGKFAYVSQTSWIQTGTIRENILFGSELEDERYQETLQRSSLVKDLELLPYGDLTEIGERGVNLSGGQKQRIQLARALYKNADIYLLDDPFSAVDAHTAKNLFKEYIMEGLKGKTVLLVTHQVDFLPAFDSILLMSDGEIVQAGSYHQLLTSSQEFHDLVNAHKDTAGSNQLLNSTFPQRHSTSTKISQAPMPKQFKAPNENQFIKQEEREIGDTGLKPYLQYLDQMKGYIFFFVASLCHLIFVVFQILQNSWMAANVDNPRVSTLKLILVYFLIGVSSTFFLCIRSLLLVALGLQSSKYLFLQLMNSLFRAPMSFYDSTPSGRILSRVSSDLSIMDIDIPFSLTFAVAGTLVFYSSLTVLAVVTWQILVVAIPMVYVAICLQRYYFASAKEVMRMNGTTKSFLANHVAETIAGAVTIRAFKEEGRSFKKNLDLIDINASAFFHSFASNEWLIQRLETISAVVLTAAALCMVMLPPGTFTPGIIGMALSYGLSLSASLVFSIQNQCTLANHIISVERLNQYMHIQSEAEEIIEGNRPPLNWPVAGKVEINNLKIRYRSDGPLVLHGITCTFKAGHKVGIVGRTGSGKSTLISALFRLVEPAEGKIIVDGIDISSIGLHDLRSRFGVIPQDPTLFNGTVRYNLDPLSQHTDQEIWEVLGKCQLKEVVQGKEEGLNSSVVENGSNWSMGQRQLFCMGRALLRKSRILVLDEATASIDNSTDTILQKTIRTEFSDCTVITVAHRIPTVMDCTMVLSISDGKLAEYDEPARLMKSEDSLFQKLVEEYWSHIQSAELR